MISKRAALMALAAAGLVWAVPAEAAELRTGTLDCGSGGVFPVSTRSLGASVRLADSRHNFVLTYLRVDLTGEELVKHSPGKEGLDTLSCVFSVDGYEPGNTATVEGFLTPRTP